MILPGRRSDAPKETAEAVDEPAGRLDPSEPRGIVYRDTPSLWDILQMRCFFLQKAVCVMVCPLTFVFAIC